MENNLKSLEHYKRLFSEARDLTADARREAQTDDDFFHGYQWTAEERKALRDRKQPDDVFNRIRPAVNGTLGVLKQGATDPRAYPRTPKDEASAEIASKILRFVADETGFDDERVNRARDYLVQGTCAVTVEVDEDNRVTVEPVRWEEFFYDPRSREADFDDARYLGCAKWMYADQLTALGADPKDVESAVAAGSLEGGLDDTFEDRPRDSQGNWIDRKHRRLMVVEMYERDGREWNRCLFYAGGIIEAGPSDYKDAKGRTVCPIIAQSCYIDRENNRYGIVRDMRGPQNEINKRRSKLLNLLNNRQVQADPAAADIALGADADLVRSEAGKPDGVLPPGWRPVPLNDLTAGQFNLLGESKAEIERMGPNPAVLAREGENASGRNNLIRQQAGLTEQAVVFGGVEHWELRVYRAMWNRVRQFWNAPDFIRVTDDEGAAEFIGINQPIQGPPQVVMAPDGTPTIQPSILGYENALAEMDMDITLDTVPDTANLAQEQFQALVDLARSGVQIPPRILIESSALPEKRKLIEKLDAMEEQNAPLAQMQQQMQQMLGQLEIMQRQADVEKTKSETVENMADAEATTAKVQIDAFEAGAKSIAG